MSGARAAVREARPEDREALLALRTAVFVDEQGVPPEEEVDDLDAVARHLVALEAGAVVGTCRLLPDAAAWTLGRMAVRRDRRRGGVFLDAGIPHVRMERTLV